MNDREIRDQIHHAMDTRLSGMTGNPYLAQQILAGAKGGKKVKRKLSVGLVLALVLALASVTALAVGLTHYFGGFADLEDQYGEYEAWPGTAKVKLVQLMADSGVLEEEQAARWATCGTGEQKEEAAEDILAQHFSGMVYVDTYNAMERELGPIENWTDEERVLYISLLEKYGKMSDSWPYYQLPGQGDLTREQAVARARDAVLAKFSITQEELDAMTVNGIFAQDAYNGYGAPKDEPFWIVEFGYGYAYRVYMTRAGEMLGIMGPQTVFIPWGESVMESAVEAVPGEHDVSYEVAVQEAEDALTEIMNVSAEMVQQMVATAHFFYSDRYFGGFEPVWLVTWSLKGENQWQVLLGYDGRYLDAGPAGKILSCVNPSDSLLSDICREHYEELNMENPHFAAGGYYGLSLEAKVQFYHDFIDIVESYVAEHPYFNGRQCSEWEWTRNVSGLPDERAITQEEARQIAQEAIRERYGDDFDLSNLSVYYYVTHPERPEWRFANAHCGIAIDAYTGEVLLIRNFREYAQSTGDMEYSISPFLAEVL